MNLLDTYKEKNKDPVWYNDYFSSAKNSFGKMFVYTGTNYRTQNSFIKQFQTFLEVENQPREKWPRSDKSGQEIHKQHVLNMLQSKLFKKDVKEVCSKTVKGELYFDFINLKVSEDERWLINYLFLINGYYANRKNYILHRVKEDLLTSFLSVPDIDIKLLINESKDLLNLENKGFSSLLRKPFFYLHSFYNDSDFLIKYFRSSEEDKEELAQYIEENYISNNLICCISKKYKSEISTKNTLLDETRVFLLTLLFVNQKNLYLDNIYQSFINEFDQNITSINKKVVKDFLFKNKNVFDPIFEEILELEDIETSDDSLIEKIKISQIDTKDIIEEYIDETSEVGRQQIKAIFSLRKKHAKMLSNYTCALETINNCKPIYFTAKKTDKNYLEVHHFIPQEFRNDFPYSIEVLANYVTLCPRCHRQIHLARDRERKHLINALYEERGKRLELVGLKKDLVEIYQYYKIDS